MKRNTSWITSVCRGVLISVLCLLTSCLKSGEESIALQCGEEDELILGEWKVDNCTFTYIDDNGAEVETSVPENMQWGNLLQPGMMLNFDFLGNCTINNGSVPSSYVIDGDAQTFQLGGQSYELISIGKNLFVVEVLVTITKPDGTTLSGTIRYYLIHTAGGEQGEGEDDGTGIPADSKAEANPEIVGDHTTTIPNVQLSTSDGVVTMDMTGIQDLINGGWLDLYGTGESGQNIWVEVDGKPKGIVVINNNENDGSVSKRMVDLVFCVDNSGSMSEEANKLAQEVVGWATKLSQQNLDIQFACVGYGNINGINGAINFTDITGISSFFNYSSGTSRTMHFAGSDAQELKTLAGQYHNCSGECGAEAVHFADDNFKFRPGANRIYVNFTDEPNQPGSYTENSVEYFNDQNNWDTTKGTIHTVFSNGHPSTYSEAPWLMSEYTGGTTLFTSSSFNVSLDNLPITGALANSYVIKVREPGATSGDTHTIKITIKDGEIQAERIFTTAIN